MSTGEPEEPNKPAVMLVESDAMFRATFEHASVGIAHVGPQGQWLNVNRRVSEIVGYPRDELLKITFQDITHPDDLNLDVGLLNEVLEGRRETYRIEKRYYHKSGRIVWVLLSVSCIRNPDGTVAYFISILQDITEKKRISRALTDSETRFRIVQETNPDGFMILRSQRGVSGEIEDFVWEFVNPAAEQLTARSANVLIGKRLSKVMPEAFARGLFNVFCNTVETGTPWRRELYYPDNGVPRWFRFTVARVGDGFAVSFQDVTARKQAELQLHASQQRQRTILDGIVSMIGLTTPSGILLEINEASLRLTGAASQDLVGKPIWQHPAWSHTRAMQDRLISAFAAHTLREATDFEGFRQSFTGRLRAIAASHDLLVSTTQDSSDISRLIRDQVLGYAPADGTRLEMTGPPLVLGPQGSHAFGLILHELATNASKYGAFSNDSGRLSISWFIEETDDDPDVIIDWVETDGPPVVPPSRKGFGSVLIEQSLSHALGGKSNLTFDPKGLKAQFRFPARR